MTWQNQKSTNAVVYIVSDKEKEKKKFWDDFQQLEQKRVALNGIQDQQIFDKERAELIGDFKKLLKNHTLRKRRLSKDGQFYFNIGFKPIYYVVILRQSQKTDAGLTFWVQDVQFASEDFGFSKELVFDEQNSKTW